MRKLIGFIPGFRTGVIWKKVIAILGYFLMTLSILLFLSSSNDSDITKNKIDIFINYMDGTLIAIFIVIIPFILLTNFAGICRKLPLLKSSKIYIRIVSLPVYFLIIFIFFAIGYSTLNSYHSNEYKIADDKKQELRKIAEKNAMEDQKRVAMLNEKKAEEKKTAEAAEKKAEEKKTAEAAEKKAEEKKTAEAAEKKAEEKKTAEAAEKKAKEKKTAEAAEKKAEEKKTAEATVKKAEDGFEIYEVDGFSMQVPNDWNEVNISDSYSYGDLNNTSIDFKKKPISKVFHFNFINDINYVMDLTIYPYDKTIGYNSFLKNNEIMADEFKAVNIPNADKAFEFIDYKDDIKEQSTRTLVVFKNNVYYEMYASHQKSFSQGGFIEYDRNNVQKFRKDIEVMFSSFYIEDRGISIENILQEKNE